MRSRIKYFPSGISAQDNSIEYEGCISAVRLWRIQTVWLRYKHEIDATAMPIIVEQKYPMPRANEASQHLFCCNIFKFASYINLPQLLSMYEYSGKKIERN